MLVRDASGNDRSPDGWSDEADIPDRTAVRRSWAAFAVPGQCWKAGVLPNPAFHAALMLRKISTNYYSDELSIE
jgi:hypothetical protein